MKGDKMIKIPTISIVVCIVLVLGILAVGIFKVKEKMDLVKANQSKNTKVLELYDSGWKAGHIHEFFLSDGTRCVVALHNHGVGVTCNWK